MEKIRHDTREELRAALKVEVRAETKEEVRREMEDSLKSRWVIREEMNLREQVRQKDRRLKNLKVIF